MNEVVKTPIEKLRDKLSELDSLIAPDKDFTFSTENLKQRVEAGEAKVNDLIAVATLMRAAFDAGELDYSNLEAATALAKLNEFARGMRASQK